MTVTPDSGNVEHPPVLDVAALGAFADQLLDQLPPELRALVPDFPKAGASDIPTWPELYDQLARRLAAVEAAVAIMQPFLPLAPLLQQFVDSAPVQRAIRKTQQQ